MTKYPNSKRYFKNAKEFFKVGKTLDYLRVIMVSGRWLKLQTFCTIRKHVASANTVFVTYFVRPNWLTPTSQTPITLSESYAD